MKYTHQLYYGNVNIEGLVSNNKYLKPVTVLMTLPVAIFGIILFSFALLPTAGVDFGRYMKLQYFRQVRIYHRVSYITEVARSLTDDKNVQNRACKQLIQML